MPFTPLLVNTGMQGIPLTFPFQDNNPAMGMCVLGLDTMAKNLGPILIAFAVGLWVGWGMSTERLCGIRATMPLLLREVTITILGE